MLLKGLVFALLQVFIFSKQCKSHDLHSMDITGITAKVNQRGINFVTEQINTFAENVLLTTTVPDFPLSVGSLGTVDLSNLNIIDLDLGKVNVTTTSPNKVTIELGKTSYKIKGSFSIVVFAVLFESDFVADVDDFYAKVRVALGRHNMTNILTVGLQDCNASIEDVSFNFSGNPLSVALIKGGLDAYRAVPGNDFTKLVGTSICPWMYNFTLKKVNTLLSKFTKTLDLPLNTTIDLSLTEDPKATSNSLQLFANGTCFPTEDPNFPVQLDDMALPALQDSTKMIQGAISQNVLNTYSQSVFSQGYLNLTFEVEDVLSLINSVTPDNTQYDVANVSGSCIDASVNIDSSEPLTFEFLPGSAPRFEIYNGSFTLFVDYKIFLHYHTSSGSFEVLVLCATFRISGNVYAIENRIGWNIYCAKIDVSYTCFSTNAIQVIKNCAVGMVNLLLNNLSPTSTLGNLNQLTLPTVLGYSPDNVEVILKKGALEFAGDISLAE